MPSTRTKLGWLAILGTLLVPGTASADYDLNMTPGVTPISHEIYDLHMLIFYICCVIATIVFGVMIWSLVRHRKSVHPVPAKFHHSTTAEIIWTIIPVVILVVMAIPATKVLVNLERVPKTAMTIKVTGHQWKWHYDYVDAGFGFFSVLAADSEKARQPHSGIDPNSVPNYLRDVDNPLVLPIKTKIRFLTTGGDVIHSWWVPALGFKKDAIPGFINESWAEIETPGIYRGQCAELCGKDHGFMPIVVKAVSQDEFFDWQEDMLAKQQEASAGAEREWGKDELMAKGKEVYTTFCQACHQPDGHGLPPAFPALAGSAIATGPLDGHINRVMNGKPGTAMAAWGPQLDDVSIAAVITYERNSFGNTTGDVVQPSQIKAARGK